MKTVWIFSDRIQDRIRLKEFRSVHIRARIFNIRYRICIRILKSHIYDVDIQSYHIRYGWHYSYSNPNKNMKTNIILMISVRIQSVFIPNRNAEEDTEMGFAGVRAWRDGANSAVIRGPLHERVTTHACHAFRSRPAPTGVWYSDYYHMQTDDTLIQTASQLPTCSREGTHYNYNKDRCSHYSYEGCSLILGTISVLKKY